MPSIGKQFKFENQKWTGLHHRLLLLSITVVPVWQAKRRELSSDTCGFVSSATHVIFLPITQPRHTNCHQFLVSAHTTIEPPWPANLRVIEREPLCCQQNDATPCRT